MGKASVIFQADGNVMPVSQKGNVRQPKGSNAIFVCGFAGAEVRA